MTQMMIVPKSIGKIHYKPSVNHYTLVYRATIVDPETKKDLKDRRHLLTVKKVREEYRRGVLVKEEDIVVKLKK